ncbi:hypothetical protein EJ04DRAFT_7706 [Polyplosphaeria fusca]|uniref:Uncharacterized protein n=1 Tax=Polyplosphaeria fusca TaxID=682080 RepID=A0A9P4R922_9PLEO|nr:hypothetical protein EJ04DRAFT_7706 [Polyplosphaeria fusca]
MKNKTIKPSLNHSASRVDQWKEKKKKKVVRAPTIALTCRHHGGCDAHNHRRPVPVQSSPASPAQSVQSSPVVCPRGGVCPRGVCPRGRIAKGSKGRGGAMGALAPGSERANGPCPRLIP